MFVAATSLLEETRGLLDRWAAVEWAACDPDAVAVGAAQLLKDADRLRAIALLAVAEHQRRGGIRREGDGSTADWVARQTRSSRSASSRAARLAARLGRAEQTARAAAEGRLSAEQADVLAGVVDDRNEAAFKAREAELIEAGSSSLEAAVEAATRFREETGESPQQLADRLHAARNASVWVGDDGLIHGRQTLAGDDGATFRNTFQAFVDREHHAGGAADGRTNAQRRADAAVEMARHAAAALNGAHPTRPPVPTVIVHVDLDDLTTGAGTAEEEATGTSITGEAARRLACDAGVVRMITRGRSEVVDVGRRTRTIPVPTRRAVLARDGGCPYPTCTAPPDWSQVHHIEHWANLGGTDLDNLIAPCGAHHHLLHEGGWSVSLDPDTQRTIWRAPDGRVLIGQRRRRPPANRERAA